MILVRGFGRNAVLVFPPFLAPRLSIRTKTTPRTRYFRPSSLFYSHTFLKPQPLFFPFDLFPSSRLSYLVTIEQEDQPPNPVSSPFLHGLDLLPIRSVNMNSATADTDPKTTVADREDSVAAPTVSTPASSTADQSTAPPNATASNVEQSGEEGQQTTGGGGAGGSGSQSVQPGNPNASQLSFRRLVYFSFTTLSALLILDGKKDGECLAVFICSMMSLATKKEGKRK